VTARNSFGGYSDFQRFIAVGQSVYASDTSPVFDGMYRDFCEYADPVVKIAP